MSEAPAGPVQDAKRSPAEAQRAPQTDGLVGPAGPVSLLTLGARGAAPALLDPDTRPTGRGLRAVQTAHVLQLQRTHGNQDLSRLINGAAQRPAPGAPSNGRAISPRDQPALTVNAPGDPFELEADRFADAVMGPSAPGSARLLSSDGAGGSAVQRACDACQAETVQRAPAADGPAPVAPGIATRIAAIRGGGQPLPDIERAFFEERSGADLGGVRVHTDATAAETSRDLNARAYTIGSDIAFGAGQYQPGTDAGHRLMAHELAHVVQQGGASPVRRAPANAAPAGAKEQPDNAEIAPSGEAAPVAAEGVCPVCGQRGTGRCPGCGQAFAPVQRLAAAPAPAASARAQRSADPAVQRVGLDDVLSLGRDGAIALVAKFSPGLADFLRNGPMGMLVEAIKGGVQTWLRGLLGGLNIGGVIGELVSGMTGAIGSIMSAPEPGCATLAAALDGLRKFGQAIASNPAVKAVQAAFSAVTGVFQKIADVLLGGAFDAISGLVGGVVDTAKKIWGWILAAKNAIGVGWDAVKKAIGLDDDENGILAKLKAKAAEGWETIKQTLAPAVGPLKTMLKTMILFSPAGPTILIIKYLPPLVEAVEWLWAHKGDADIVKSAQQSHPMLAKLLGAARSFGEGVQSAASALAKGAADLQAAVLGVLGAITGLPLLSAAQGIVQSVSEGVQKLLTLAQTGLDAAAKGIGAIYNKAKALIEPYIETLIPLGLAIVNPAMIPVILAGKAWAALPDCYKEPIINFLLDAAISFLKGAPQVSMFGPLWEVLKGGVIGFIEGVRGRSRDEKIRITNKLAKILGGGNPRFLLGYAKGLMIGLWKGLTMPFELVYDLLKLMHKVEEWAEHAGEQALDNALKPAGPVPAAAGAGAAAGSAPPPIRRAPAATTPAPGPAGAEAVQQKLSKMLGEIRPPIDTVLAGFMPAMKESYSAGGGITYAEVRVKLARFLDQGEKALHAKGKELADMACTSFLNDKNDEELGEDIGDVSGQVLFEVILFVLTEGLIEALKPLQAIAKMFDFVGEAMGAAIKGLGKLGHWIADGVKELATIVEHSPAGKKIVQELEKIGEILLRYAEELIELVGGRAGREAAELSEKAGAKGAKEGLEKAGEKGAKEGLEKGGEKAEKEAAEELEQRGEAIVAAKGITAVNQIAHVPVLALLAELDGLKSRYRWLKGFTAEPLLPGHFRVIMRTTIDDDYKDPTGGKAAEELLKAAEESTKKAQQEAFERIKATRELLDQNPTLKGEFEQRLRTLEENLKSAREFAKEASDAESHRLAQEEFENLQKQAKELEKELEAKGATKPVEPVPQEEPAFVRENRAPQDAETALVDPARFTQTEGVAGGRRVYVDAQGNAYYVDRFHKGRAAEIEKFAAAADGAKHLGTVRPDGSALGPAVPNRTFSFDR